MHESPSGNGECFDAELALSVEICGELDRAVAIIAPCWKRNPAGRGDLRS